VRGRHETALVAGGLVCFDVFRLFVSDGRLLYEEVDDVLGGVRREAEDVYQGLMRDRSCNSHGTVRG